MVTRLSGESYEAICTAQRVYAAHPGGTALQRLHRAHDDYTAGRMKDREALQEIAKAAMDIYDHYGLSLMVVPDDAVQAATQPGNLASVTLVPGILWVERQVLENTELLLRELKHEIGTYLLDKLYNGSIPRIPEIGGYATHALDDRLWERLKVVHREATGPADYDGTFLEKLHVVQKKIAAGEM